MITNAPHNNSINSTWMFKRINIPKIFRVSNRDHYQQMTLQYRKFNYYVSKLMKFSKLTKYPYPLFRVLMRVIRVYFKIVNQLEIKGKNKIPNQGCIFYVNHPGSLDVVLLLASVGHPVGVFVAYDNFYFLNIIEKYYGLINKHKVLHDERLKDLGSGRDVLIELMIRNILEKNRYFAIWPGGSLSKSGRVKQGFSSVVRAYSVINATNDRIPLVPVLIQGSECYHIGVNPQLRPKLNKIRISFLEPYFLPREWLNKIEDGGKTPRQIIDYMMLKLAKANGQKSFIKNKSLEWAKSSHQKSNN